MQRLLLLNLENKDHKQTLDEITALGAKCLFVPIDVSDVNSVKQAINTTVEKFGRLDVAFNNAGIGGVYSGIHDMDEKVWDRLIAVNLTGQLYCVKYELQ